MKATLKFAGVLAVALFLTASRAAADGVHYYFSNGSGQHLDFNIANNPNPQGFSQGQTFVLYNVLGSLNGQQTDFTLGFLTNNGAYGQWGINAYSNLLGSCIFFAFGNTPLYTDSNGYPSLFSVGDGNINSWGWGQCHESIQSVPEPASLLLLGVGGAALLGFRRKRTA